MLNLSLKVIKLLLSLLQEPCVRRRGAAFGGGIYVAGRWPLGMVWVELGTHEHRREAEGLGSLGFGPIFVFF